MFFHNSPLLFGKVCSEIWQAIWKIKYDKGTACCTTNCSCCFKPSWKWGGILSEKEASNFLLGKVGDPHIMSYVNHVARKNNGNRRAQHAIVPDIHAMNFPAGKQRINDSGSSRVVEAIFEVKTFTACKSRYRHNNTKTAPLDRRARMIVSS